MATAVSARRRLAVPGLRPRVVAICRLGSRVAAARPRRARQPLDDLVEQLADALPVLGADLENRIEAELVELERAGLARADRRSC